MKFTGGYTYRFLKSDGSSDDYVFAGSNGADTLWRLKDKTLRTGSEAFRDTVEITEIARPDRASNEAR